jgi:hypothetical protein
MKPLRFFDENNIRSPTPSRHHSHIIFGGNYPLDCLSIGKGKIGHDNQYRTNGLGQK